MKRKSVLTGLLVCIVLVGCGNADNTSEEPQAEVRTKSMPVMETVSEDEPKDDYSEYADLINMIEAEDYDSAVEYINELRPEPQLEKVELSTENYRTYYDVGLITGEPRNKYDAYGELVTVQNSYAYGFVMKPEYKERLVSEAGNKVIVGVEYDTGLYPAFLKNLEGEIDVDYNTCTVISAETAPSYLSSSAKKMFLDIYNKHISKTYETIETFDCSTVPFGGANILKETGLGADYVELSAADFTEQDITMILPANLNIVSVSGNLTFSN